MQYLGAVIPPSTLGISRARQGIQSTRHGYPNDKTRLSSRDSCSGWDYHCLLKNPVNKWMQEMDGSPPRESAVAQATAPTTAANESQRLAVDAEAPTQTYISQSQQEPSGVKREAVEARSPDEQASSPTPGETNAPPCVSDAQPPQPSNTPVKVPEPHVKCSSEPLEPPADASGAPDEPGSVPKASQDGEGTQVDVPPSQLPTDEEITSRLQALLTEVDLQSTTGGPVLANETLERGGAPSSLAWPGRSPHSFIIPFAEKMLRRRLEQEFSTDLSSKKALLRAEVGSGRNPGTAGAHALRKAGWVLRVGIQRKPADHIIPPPDSSQVEAYLSSQPAPPGSEADEEPTAR